MTLILHANPRSSNAQKVRFLLGELGLAAEIREVPFGVDRPAWHLAVNPVGGIPALVDGDLQLAESHAILRYLAAREGRTDLYPEALAERARRRLAAGRHRDDGAGGDAAVRRRGLRWRRRHGIGADAPAADSGAAALAEAAPTLRAFASLLDPAGNACLGRFTLADIAAAPYLHRIVASGNSLVGLERYSDWATAILPRAAWQAIASETGV